MTTNSSNSFINQLTSLTDQFAGALQTARQEGVEEGYNMGLKALRDVIDGLMIDRKNKLINAIPKSQAQQPTAAPAKLPAHQQAISEHAAKRRKHLWDLICQMHLEGAEITVRALMDREPKLTQSWTANIMRIDFKERLSVHAMGKANQYVYAIRERWQPQPAETLTEVAPSQPKGNGHHHTGPGLTGDQLAAITGISAGAV